MRCPWRFSSTGISASNLIIMSDSSPVLTPAPNVVLSALKANGFVSYTFNVADTNGNPMPAGTVVSATVQGKGLSISPPSSFTYPCTTEPIDYSFGIVIDPTQASSSGTIQLDIKTKGTTGTGAVETVVTYSIAIT